ncbi:MAG TPA: hypothetical protein VGE69_01540 [Pseudomonadales bacterium]
MLKKTLLALGVAWTGTAAAASSGLDDVTMNIVNESAFQEIINAQPAEIEQLLQVNANAQPVRTVVLRNTDGELLNATPVNSQVLTVNRELNQGMVSFSFICAEGQDCQQRVQNLNATGGFMLSAPVGAGINVSPNGIEIAPRSEPAVGTFEIVEGPGVFTTAPVQVRNFDAGSDASIGTANVLPLEVGNFAPVDIKQIDTGNLGVLNVLPVDGVTIGLDAAPLDVHAFEAGNVQIVEGALPLDSVIFTPAAGL